MTTPPLRARLLLLLLLLAGLSPWAGAQPTAREERKARGLLKAVERAAHAKKWSLAHEKLEALRDAHAQTETCLKAASQIAAYEQHARFHLFGAAGELRADLAVAGKKKVRITYDFADADALTWAQFETVRHLPDRDGLFRVGARLRGSGALVLKAPFVGEVSLHAEVVVHTPQDVGLAFFDPAEMSRFVVGNAGNRFFATKYGAGRRVVSGHALAYCGRGAESLAKRNPAQIIGSRSASALASPARLQLTLRKGTFAFSVGAAKILGKLTNAEQRFARSRVGLSIYRGDIEVRRLSIEGTLDPAWSSKRLDRLRDRLPPLPEREL